MPLPPPGLVPPFLLEAFFFFTLTWGRLWAAPAGHAPRRIAATGIAPYLVYALLAGQFRFSSLVVLACLVLIPALWFAVLPRSRVLDLSFLAVMTAIYVSNAFELIYSRPEGWPRADILGKAMWIRSGIAGALYVAREKGIGFGFWPTRTEWRIGTKQFLYFLPAGAAVGFSIGLLRFPQSYDAPRILLQALGMFFGTLWFIAVAEEFFFRGLIQRWTNLPLAAVLYGLAHIGFRQFPNWKHVLLTICLGFFCGRAFAEAGSVRAAMVTHALTVATWVLVFGKI